MRIEGGAGAVVDRVRAGDVSLGSPPARGRRLRRSREFAGANSRSRERLVLIAAIGLPCLLSAVMTAWQLGTRSLWLDEGATVSIAAQHGGALWSAIAHDGGNMLGYYLAMHVVIGCFGDGSAVIRIPSAIATVATVGLVGLIAVRLFDRRVAFAGALFTAVSLPLVFWGQDARGYAPLVMFCAASFYTFILIVDGQDAPSRRLLAAYVLSTALAAYMGFAGALVIGAQLLLLAFRRERLRPSLIAIGIVAVACVPLLALAAGRGSSQLFWVPSPNVAGIGQTASWLTSAGLTPNFPLTTAGAVLLILTIPLTVLALAASFRRGWQSLGGGLAGRGIAWAGGERWGTLVVLCWVAVPIAAGVAESAAGQPIVLARNSIVCLPAMALALAWRLVGSPGGRSRWRAVLGWGLVIVLLALRAAVVIGSYGVSPENWKAAERYVLTSAGSGDCVAFYPLDGRMVFDYYVRTGGQELRAPLPANPVTPWYRIRPFVEDYGVPSLGTIDRVLSTCPRLWLLASHQGELTGPPGSRSDFIRYRLLQVILQGAYPHHRFNHFSRSARIDVELLSRPRGSGAPTVSGPQ